MTSENESYLSSASVNFWDLDVREARTRLLNALSVIGARPILFGAGGVGRETLAIFRKAGIDPSCFADDTPAKQGSTLDGLRVVSIAEALAKQHRPTVVVCLFSPRHQFESTARRVREINPNANVLPFFTAWFSCQKEAFEHYFFQDPLKEMGRLETYRELHQVLHDDTSRTVLNDHLRLRLLHDTNLWPTHRTDIDFFSDVLRQPKLVYVDAGAFDGDTIEDFVSMSGGHFSRAFALEPDTVNRVRMEARFSGLSDAMRSKITIRPEGVWRETGHIGFSSEGHMGSMIDLDAAQKVQVVSLDDLLAEEKLNPILIKIDVEGAELEALSGGADLGARSQVAWAISVYHHPEHLVQVYRWLSSRRPDYRYALRCHGGDGSDLMLYAW